MMIKKIMKGSGHVVEFSSERYSHSLLVSGAHLVVERIADFDGSKLSCK